MQNHKEFIQKAKGEYKKIGYIECPVFGGEKIYFSRYGINHILRKGKDQRPIEQQMRRMGLLPHAVQVIQKAQARVFSEGNNVSESLVTFWTLYGEIDSIKIKVVIRQLGNSNKHFFSVMDIYT